MLGSELPVSGECTKIQTCATHRNIIKVSACALQNQKNLNIKDHEPGNVVLSSEKKIEKKKETKPFKYIYICQHYKSYHPLIPYNMTNRRL